MAKSTARETYDAHFSLKSSVFDPECLSEPLRSMAMRALAHREEIIAGRKSVGRTFTDFARERLLRGADVEGVDFVPSIRAD